MVARLGRAGYSTKVGVPADPAGGSEPGAPVRLTGTGSGGESTRRLEHFPVTGEAPRKGGRDEPGSAQEHFRSLPPATAGGRRERSLPIVPPRGELVRRGRACLPA